MLGAGDQDLAALAAGLLSVVFLFSGGTKVRSPFGAALALARFRVVARVRPSLGRALGSVEVALGVWVAWIPHRFAPFAAAAALLGAFTVLLARALRAGERFPCACFGTASRAMSWLTVTRTVLLLAVAAVGAAVAVQDGAPPSPTQRLLGLLAGVVVTCIAMLATELYHLRPFATRLDDDAG